MLLRAQAGEGEQHPGLVFQLAQHRAEGHEGNDEEADRAQRREVRAEEVLPVGDARRVSRLGHRHQRHGQAHHQQRAEEDGEDLRAEALADLLDHDGPHRLDEPLAWRPRPVTQATRCPASAGRRTPRRPGRAAMPHTSSTRGTPAWPCRSMLIRPTTGLSALRKRSSASATISPISGGTPVISTTRPRKTRRIIAGVCHGGWGIHRATTTGSESISSAKPGRGDQHQHRAHGELPLGQREARRRPPPSTAAAPPPARSREGRRA